MSSTRAQQPAVAQRSNGRTARSTPPGYYRRAQVEALLGLTSTERDTFERAGILRPREQRDPSDKSPVLYSPVDMALARAAMNTHRLGLRGEALRRVMDALRAKQRRLVPGWSGVALVDDQGDVELIRTAGEAAAVLAERWVDASQLVIYIEVSDSVRTAS